MERTFGAAHVPEWVQQGEIAAQVHLLRRIFQIAPVPGLIFDSFRLVGTNDAARTLISQQVLTPELLVKARSAAYATDGGSGRPLFDGPTVKFRTLVAAPEGDRFHEDRLRICFLLPAGAASMAAARARVCHRRPRPRPCPATRYRSADRAQDKTSRVAPRRPPCRDRPVPG